MSINFQLVSVPSVQFSKVIPEISRPGRTIRIALEITVPGLPVILPVVSSSVVPKGDLAPCKGRYERLFLDLQVHLRQDGGPHSSRMLDLCRRCRDRPLYHTKPDFKFDAFGEDRLRGEIKLTINCPNSHHPDKGQYMREGYYLRVILSTAEGMEVCSCTSPQPIRIAQTRSSKTARYIKASPSVRDELTSSTACSVDENNNSVDGVFGVSIAQPLSLSNLFLIPTIQGISPCTGPVAGGSIIFLDGENFQSDLYVIRFGRSSTKAFRLNPTQLVCSLPPATPRVPHQTCVVLDEIALIEPSYPPSVAGRKGVAFEYEDVLEVLNPLGELPWPTNMATSVVEGQKSVDMAGNAEWLSEMWTIDTSWLSPLNILT